MQENKSCTDCVREDCHGCDVTNKSRIEGVTRGINLKDQYEKGRRILIDQELINAAKVLDDEKEEYISKCMYHGCVYRKNDGLNNEQCTDHECMYRKKTDEVINAAKEVVDKQPLSKMSFDFPNTPINPKHYNDQNTDVIKFCMDNNLDFMQGNIIKYVVRYKQKNGIEDLKKSAEYLRRLIEREEINADNTDNIQFMLKIPDGTNIEEYKKKIDELLKQQKTIPVTSMDDIEVKYTRK